jgi:hypothetical protein
MWLPEDKTKFTSRFKYVEFARWAYSEKQQRWSVFRDGKKGPRLESGKDGPRIPIFYTWEEVLKKIDHKSVGGYYTSTFAFDRRELKNSQSISSMYFDLDANEKKGHDPLLALEEVRRLYPYLLNHVPEEAIRIYFTGKKGFHVEAEAVALGVGPSADLAATFRFMAESVKEELDMETIDFQVYDPRRMWRIPNTKHQGTGLYKVPLEPSELELSLEEIEELAKEPREMVVPPQKFSLKANEWYRGFVYKKDEKKLSHEEMVTRFMKNGSGIARDVGELEFDPTCFGECDGLERLWRKAETEHNLEHEERLFLCSILTYSEQAIEYLHAILMNCDDYDPDKSQAHINDWVKRRDLGIGGNPYSCQRAKSAGIVCNNCDNLEPREKYEVINDRMVPTGEMAKPSPVRLCYTRRKNKRL